MQDVPKIVRERLRATTALNHPDADVLTAFAEHSLTERERAGVLEHLARCGHCRVILALAVPASEQLQPAWKPSPRSWLTRPALRWGFIAVGMVAIASVSFVEYKHSQEGPRVAYKAPAPQPAAEANPEAASRTAPRSAAQTQKPAESRPRESPASGELNQIVGSPVASSANSGLTRGGPVPLERFPQSPKMAMQWQPQKAVQGQPAAPLSTPKQQASDEVSAKVKAPSASEMVEGEAQAVQLPAQAASQARPGYDYASANIARAKPAVEPAPLAPMPMQASSGANLPSFSPAPRWTINSSGGLERSFDQGNTWQEVNVNALPGLRLDAPRTMAQAQDADSGQQDTKKAAAGNPIFRVVAANGAEVWAGGSHGALYHSIDAGNHWTRIVPFAAGTMLTGDITALQFSDSQHCRASTSTGELWSTGDGGQSWQRQ
jgi:hypothetical protein